MDTSPGTDADFEVAATFVEEPSMNELNTAIVECLEGSEREDEIVVLLEQVIHAQAKGKDLPCALQPRAELNPSDRRLSAKGPPAKFTLSAARRLAH